MLHIGRIALSTKNIKEAEVGDCIANTLSCFCKKNNITSSKIKAIIFSQTDDIVTLNPAQCLRKVTDEYAKIALFCTKEPLYPEGVLEKGIRMMVFFQKRTFFSYVPVPVYMYDAEDLRKDIPQ